MKPAEHTRLSSRFLRLTVLNVGATITVPLASLVDTAMLGHLDEIRFLAGVALGSVLFDYISWTFGFLRMGTTGTAAIAYGAGANDRVFFVLYRALFLALVFGILIFALHGPIRELGFAVLGGEAGVESAGRDYFNARVLGVPALLCNFAFVGWFLGREESGRALVLVAATNITNIGLNYVFIVRWGWAAYGAGAASALSQYVGLAIACALLVATGPVAWRAHEVLRRDELLAQMRLNADILVRTICLVTSFALFTNASAVLGTLPLAANSILLRVYTTSAFIIDGVAHAAEALVGQMRGRGDREGVRYLFRFSLGVGWAVAGVYLVAFWLLREPVLGLLTSHAEVIDMALRASWWVVPGLFFGAAAWVYDGLFLGLTEGAALRNSMLFSTALVFLPILAVATQRESIDGLWLAMVALMAARTVTLYRASRPFVSVDA